eukprot:m.136710 g.136710  ORF g.136710 m.136710 type:complete len:236 (-) comp14735_c0_seq4:1524-2231(-)
MSKSEEDAGAIDGTEPKRRKIDDEEKQERKLRFAVVCSSNQNRSMEAHNFLKKRGFEVKSYGSGNQVKIPGPSIDKPNKWDFDGTTYDEMYKELERQDKDLYTQNGMLSMLDRNRNIKKHPERFQSSKEEFDVIITCENRVYDQVLEGNVWKFLSKILTFMQDLEERPEQKCEPVHVCNVEIKDNHEEATRGALSIVELCEKLEKTKDLENEIEEVLDDFNEKLTHPVLHNVAFY